MLLMIFYFYFSKLFALPELAETEKSVFAIYSYTEFCLEFIFIGGFIATRNLKNRR